MKLLRLFSGLLVAVAAGPVLAQGVTLPEVGRLEFENGVVVILLEKEDVPLIGIEATVNGGGVCDPEGLEGLANLLAGILTKGAGERSASEFADAIDSVGGELSAAADTESINISAEFMARDADLMIELLADLLRRPALDAEEIRKLRDRSIDEIRAAKDGNASALLASYGSAFLFGEHPYARALGGSEESLANISVEDVRDYYANYFGGNRLIIAVAGDFEASAMAGKLNVAFADWGPADGELPQLVAPERSEGSRVLLVDKPGSAQSYFWIGNTGVSLHYESRAELNIANTLFGGRYTSVLMTELRAKSGLAYDARSVLRRRSVGGSVAIESFSESEATIEAIDLALSLLEKLRAEGVADDMIASGKNYILGQYTPRFETASQLAGQFAGLESYGLDASYVNDYGAAVANADAESINAVIKEIYPASDSLVFTIIGDAEQIREQVAKYGPVTEMSITDPRFTPE